MKRKTISRREFFKITSIAVPSMVFAVRSLIKPQPAEQVSTEGTMTLARYDDDDLFDASDLQLPIGRPGLASVHGSNWATVKALDFPMVHRGLVSAMMGPDRGVFMGGTLTR